MLPVLQSPLALCLSTLLEECWPDCRRDGEGEALTPWDKCRLRSVLSVVRDPTSGVIQSREPCSKDASVHMCIQAK